MTRLWPAGEEVEVWGREGSPAGFVWRGTRHGGLQVCNRWRVHTRWWLPEEVVRREYVKVTTGTGLLCLLYRDLTTGRWFLARLYD